jgi:hypothetical protein
VLAELERDLIRAGPEMDARAMAAGVKFGRKPKLTPHQAKEAIRRIDAGESQPPWPGCSTSISRLFHGW